MSGTVTAVAEDQSVLTLTGTVGGMSEGISFEVGKLLGDSPQATNTARELVQPDGSLRCARCGSTQFETKISTRRKLMFGVGSVLGSGNEIKCFACGARYKRG
jgi:hypothetical protein